MDGDDPESFRVASRAARLLLNLPAMRFATLVFASLCFSLAACTVRTVDGSSDLDSSSMPPNQLPQNGTITPGNPTPDAPDDGIFREVVSVTMTAKDKTQWFCTGTLVAEDKVVTAAHCLDPQKFASYVIVAPLAPGKPRVAATAPKIFGGPFQDVANPDVGFLTLTTPIVLPRYGQMTDVVANVEAKQPVEAAAIVRMAEKPDAAFAESEHMPVSSTVAYGYEHGFGTPMFSKGGDSGAGLFLVENGKITHKLIAVARQPEPERDLDHFTRLGAPFQSWYAQNTGE
jgi:hypothetical protein